MSPAFGRALATAVFVLAAGCGRTVPTDSERVVVVTAPSLPPREPVVELLATPVPTPSPTPSPTPLVTPRVTRRPSSAPEGATLTARSGAQEGAPRSYCWSEREGRRSCVDFPEPDQPKSLAVAAGEQVILRLRTDLAPTGQRLTAFQNPDEDVPSQNLEPALTTTLRIDLDPGRWWMDVCADWRGYGTNLCWRFLLQVAGGGRATATPAPATPPPTDSPSPTPPPSTGPS